MTDIPYNAFVFDSSGRLVFRGDGWTLAAESGRGWVDWRIGEAQFLHATGQVGGLVFHREGRFVTHLPDLNNITGDADVGRIASVADGLFLARLSPGWRTAEAELYIGFNDEADHEVVVYLSDAVALVRLDDSEQRTRAERIVRHGDPVVAAEHRVSVVHEVGCAIEVEHPCRVGSVRHPAGGERLALVFDAAGFAANSFALRFDCPARDANFINRPAFDVTHDKDGQVAGRANRGVGNPVYDRDSNVEFAIAFDWLGDGAFEGSAELEIVHSLGQAHARQRVTLEGLGTGTHRVAFDQIQLTQPGVSEVWARLCDRDGRVIWTDRYRMLYDWPHFKPNYVVPDDLRSFWDRTLEELRSRPLEAEATRVFEDHPGPFEIYHVRFNSLGDRRIHAMLYVPENREGPLPAIVGSHPGARGFGINRNPDGTYGSELNKDPRFVTIAPLIRGHAPDDPTVGFNHPWWGPMEDRQTYAARYWYAALVRSIDYLAEQGDLVDLRRIVAHGGSQGGNFALATAALDSRVALCLADAPSNAMPHEILTKYGSFGPSAGQVPEGKTRDDVIAMLSYFDVANLAAWIKCPTYIGLSVGDLTVHAMGGLAAYRNLTQVPDDQKGFYPGPSYLHANSAEGIARHRAEFDRIAGRPLS